MGNYNISFRDIQQAQDEFIKERNWQEFHTPKNLALAIVVEAAELLRELQWKSDRTAVELSSSQEFQCKVGEELADVVILCASLANYLGLDLGNSALKKINSNRKKYPKGTAGTYATAWRKGRMSDKG